ncbi:MAG TPA: bile acid:sodium symporter family protein [Candidatus Limnocylindrales bacterium]|nr:bile acid:sodium symporter family protein [Candidatus Limnocylindrales bacterium]
MFERIANLATTLFPLWVVLAGAAALYHPPLFTWFSGPLIVWGLAIIMLGMGITLSVDDFRRVATIPGAVVAGVVAQFLIMPLMGWASAHAFALPPPLAVGVILVGCCPGGTASNVVSYLARANVALSVLMTMCSTIAAVVMTPLLTKALAGTLVPVDAWGLFVSTLQVVLIPVLLGIGLNHAAPGLVRRVLPVAPLISVLTIVLICASIAGQSRDALFASGLGLLAAVFMLHAGGFGLGYVFGRVASYGETINRTISIEVGMQNSGLGAVLARQHFPDPATALPAAISATVHSLIGSILAAYWRTREPEDQA